MGAFEFLSRLFRHPFSDTDSEPIPDEVVELASQAPGETVTPDVLANRTNRSDLAVVEYLSDDERPKYVLHGNQLLISDGDSCTSKYPTRDTQVVISDRRLLIVLGGRFSDDLWEVPFEDVLDAYIDAESWKRYLIVEADRENQRMTFFVDVTLESNAADVQAGVEHVLERGP